MAEGQFSVFMDETGLAPRVVSSLLNAREHQASLPYLSTLVLPYSAKSNGLPAPDELSRIYKLESKIQAALTDSAALFLGHSLSNKQALLGFASKGPLPDSIKVKTSLLKTETFTLQSQHDPDWSWYAENLEITTLQFQEQRDAQVLAQLKKHGDDSSLVRPIDVFFFCPSIESRLQLAERLEAEGMAPQTPFSPGPSKDGSFPLALTFEGRTIPEEIGRLREICVRCGEQFGCVYDGWGSPIAP